MKKGFAIAILLLFSLTFMGQIRQTYYPGGELEFHVNVVNLGIRDQDDLRITVFIPELGIYDSSNTFDLDDGDKTSRVISVYMPKDAIGNSYVARLTLSNDKVKDVRYIWATLY